MKELRSGAFWTLVGVFSGLGGSLLTVMSLSYHVREDLIDFEVNRYGFPLPWLSKAVSTFFGSLVEQARAPPQVDFVAFVLDFTFFTAVVIVLILSALGLVWGVSSLSRRVVK